MISLESRAMRCLLPTAALLSLLLMGCPTAGGDPAIELGTGEIEFTPLSDGDELLIVFGPQGGYHVEGAFRVAGVDPGDRNDLTEPRNPRMEFDLVTEGGTLVMIGEIQQGLDDAPSSAAPYTHELLGRRVILDIVNDQIYNGDAATFSVELTDADGVVLSDSVDVVLAPHPLN